MSSSRDSDPRITVPSASRDALTAFSVSPLLNEIPPIDLSKLFGTNQIHFYDYISSYAAIPIDVKAGDGKNEIQEAIRNGRRKGNLSEELPLRYVTIDNAVKVVMSPGVSFSFYNSILSSDMVQTIQQSASSSSSSPIDADDTLQTVLSLASHYHCPLRSLVHTSASQYQSLLHRLRFVLIPSTDGTCRSIDFTKRNKEISLDYKSYLSESAKIEIEIIELDDDNVSEDKVLRERNRKYKHDWGIVLTQSFGFRQPEIHEPFYASVWSRVPVGPTRPVRMWVALRKGKVIGGSQLSINSGVTCLFNVSVLKEERKNGLGKALSVIPVKATESMNYRYIILQASPAGAPVYARLGFVPLPNGMVMYIKISTVAWWCGMIEFVMAKKGIMGMFMALAMLDKLKKSQNLAGLIVVLMMLILSVGWLLSGSGSEDNNTKEL